MESEKPAKKPIYKYKGRFITKKKLDKKLRLISKIAEATKLRRERAAAELAEVSAGPGVESVFKGNLKTRKIEYNDNNQLEGNRLINIRVLAESMMCCRCKQALSLQDVVCERKLGLYSAIQIRCRQCKIVTEVNSSSVHFEESQKPQPDVNRQIVLGSIAAGISSNALNKFLGSLELPTISRVLFKRYRDELHAKDTAENTIEDAREDTAEDGKEDTFDEISQVLDENGDNNQQQAS